jgi:hypothetical protein
LLVQELPFRWFSTEFSAGVPKLLRQLTIGAFFSELPGGVTEQTRSGEVF